MDVGRGTLGGRASRRISPAAAQRCSAPPTAARLHRVPPAAVWVLGFLRQQRGGAPLHHRHPQVWRPLPPQRAPAPAVARGGHGLRRVQLLQAKNWSLKTR